MNPGRGIPFDGEYDIVHFVRLAAELGLYVIVRPGPYVCTEWDLGGLPSWLLSYPGLRLRCHDPVYLEKVDRYFDALLPRLTPLLSTNGGPIIAMQIENEYGSYGNDKIYLRHLRDGMRSRGIDVLLFTSDGDLDSMLTGGTLEGVHKTVNFGSRVEHNFGALRKHMPEGPLMCSEYWDGWFDHWGEESATAGTERMPRLFWMKFSPAEAPPISTSLRAAPILDL